MCTAQGGPDLVVSSTLKGMLRTPQEAGGRGERPLLHCLGVFLVVKAGGEGKRAVPDQPPHGTCAHCHLGVS